MAFGDAGTTPTNDATPRQTGMIADATSEEAIQNSGKKQRKSKRVANADIEARAIGIVRSEKQRWEVATAFVTDRVSFKMRQLIRICRKNYYGIFDNPIDQMTNLEKVWYPLTEINVEAVVKNIDIDQKDINFRSRTADGQWMTELTRAHVRDKLSEMFFGQMLDDAERMMAIDGTVVWKTYEEYGKLQNRMVDLLNIYIDPTSPSIQAAYRFTERALMFPEEIAAMNGWRNTADIKPVEGLPRVDPYFMNQASQVNSNVKMQDVYECWGKIPLSLITGLVADDTTEVDGHLVVSGLDSSGNPRCHLIELNNKKDRTGLAIKPYEEAWYTRVPNRWYGRGIAEKLLTMQIYANLVFNFRINRSRISQLGLFKAKKGAGITPQMLSRLPSNGVVVLNNLEDLEQLVVQDVSQTSYTDEEVINTLSERLTNAFDVTTGENMPASTPATNAAIQNQNAKSGFSVIKDGFGLFIERWMNRHALPILAKELTTDEIVRITSDVDGYAQIVERVVMNQALKALEKSWNEDKYLPSPQEITSEIQSATEKLQKSHMFVTLVQDIMAERLDTIVYVTNEEMDVAITVQNLINMMSVAPEYHDDLVRQTFDLLGLPPPKKPQQQAQPQGQPQPPQAGGNVQPASNPSQTVAPTPVQARVAQQAQTQAVVPTR